MINTTTEKKANILIADDEKNILFLYSQALAMANYHVILARDGEEALEKLKTEKEKVDLVLLDVIMPRLDGFDTLEKIKKEPKWKEIPVILLTNLDMPEDRAEAKKLGANDYLVKVATTPKILIKRIDDFLKK